LINWFGFLEVETSMLKTTQSANWHGFLSHFYLIASQLICQIFILTLLHLLHLHVVGFQNVLYRNCFRTFTLSWINIELSVTLIFLYNKGASWPAQITYSLLILQGGADKSLARPGRKHATATELGIYSTYSPRSTIQFLARCSNFCKPLKKIQKFVRPIRSPWQQWPPRSNEKLGPFNCFFSPGNRW